jgi:hypothetical protein
MIPAFEFTRGETGGSNNMYNLVNERGAMSIGIVTRHVTPRFFIVSKTT